MGTVSSDSNHGSKAKGFSTRKLLVMTDLPKTLCVKEYTGNVDHKRQTNGISNKMQPVVMAVSSLATATMNDQPVVTTAATTNLSKESIGGRKSGNKYLQLTKVATVK